MNSEIIQEYYQLIKNRLSQSRINSALASVEKLLEHFPKSDMGYYYLGVCNFAEEKYEEALKNYKIAIKLNPANARAYFNLGICYYLDSYYDEALINIGKALIVFSKQKDLEAKKRCFEALNFIQAERDA